MNAIADYRRAGSTAPVLFGTPVSRLGSRIAVSAVVLVRAGLVLVIAWIGAMKFTAYEAQAIEPLVSHSPLLSWVYKLASVRGFSAMLGVVELGIATLIALRVPSPRLSAIGSALAVGMFATTLSFLISTPGAFEGSAGGFPALSVIPGQFLVKDVLLLSVSIFLLGDALAATNTNAASHHSSNPTHL